jgi:lipoyl-dependent peroxiredoxin subunit D
MTVEQLLSSVPDYARDLRINMGSVLRRFRHFVAASEKYAAVPARLRMQVIRSHGSDPVDLELWCLAVSAINGCSACVAAHEKVLCEKGVSEEAIVAAVRIAATVRALAAVFDAEPVRQLAA